MDEEDDIYDWKNWLKSNPMRLWNKDNTPNMDKVKIVAEKAIDAKEKQGEDLLNFLTKDLNRWVTYYGEGLVDLEKLALCKSKLKIQDMQGKRAYLGIDLSSGGDLTSIALIFYLDDIDKFTFFHILLCRSLDLQNMKKLTMYLTDCGQKRLINLNKRKLWHKNRLQGYNAVSKENNRRFKHRNN